MMGDFVERNAVMNSIIAEYNRKGDRDGLKLAWIEKAVNEVPSELEQRPCDAVSREAAVNACLNGWNKDYKEIVADIRALPSVTPVEKVGHWFADERSESNREIICSNCEQPIFKYHKMDFDYRPNFCPNCGSKMREVKG